MAYTSRTPLHALFILCIAALSPVGCGPSQADMESQARAAADSLEAQLRLDSMQAALEATEAAAAAAAAAAVDSMDIPANGHIDLEQDALLWACTNHDPPHEGRSTSTMAQSGCSGFRAVTR